MNKEELDALIRFHQYGLYQYREFMSPWAQHQEEETIKALTEMLRETPRFQFSLDDTLGKQLKLARKGRGLTLKQLGKLSGVSHPEIGRIEQGKRTPNYLIVGRLEKALGDETRE